MIPNDLREIYFANYIGKKKSINYYTNPIKIDSNIVENTLSFVSESLGRFKDFDITLNIPVGSETQRIDENCVFWVNVSPNASNNNYDYVVARLGTPNKNYIIVYCKSVATNNGVLYYSTNKKDIYEFNLPYDSKTNTAIIRFNKFIPFDRDSLIWNKKPKAINDTEGRLVYSRKIINYNCYTIEFTNYTVEENDNG